MRHADRWALDPAPPEVDLARVMERVAGVIRGIEPNDSPERFRSLGVDVILGAGRFVGPDAFEVDGRRLTGEDLRHRHRVAAGGAADPRPRRRAVPDQRDAVRRCARTCRTCVVVGGGPIGCEMAQAFRRLGSEVTVVDLAPGILPREDVDLATVVQPRADRRRRALSPRRDHRPRRSRRGAAGDIRLTLKPAHGGAGRRSPERTCCWPRGAKANVEGLDLEAAGVVVDQGRIVNTDLRTGNPNIYVIGDAAGGHQFTHVAEHHAGIVLRHAHLPHALGQAVAGRALVHLHRSGARARRPVGSRGEDPRRRPPRLPLPVRRDRPRAGRGRDRGVRQAGDVAQGQAARRGDRRSARRRADRRIRAGADQGHEGLRHLRRRSTPTRRWRRSTAALPTSGRRKA